MFACQTSCTPRDSPLLSSQTLRPHKQELAHDQAATPFTLPTHLTDTELAALVRPLLPYIMVNERLASLMQMRVQSRSRWGTLYNDLLASCFSILPLNDLAHVIHINKHWSAISQMPVCWSTQTISVSVYPLSVCKHIFASFDEMSKPLTRISKIELGSHLPSSRGSLFETNLKTLDAAVKMISELPYLKELTIRPCAVPIIEAFRHLSKAKNLTHLEIRCVDVGNVPEVFTQLTNLVKLDAAYSKLTYADIKAVVEASSATLECIELGGRLVTDSMIALLSQCSNLRDVFIGESRVTTAGISSFSNCPLTSLTVLGCNPDDNFEPMDDAMVKISQRCTELQSLTIAVNDISAVVTCRNLTKLSLHYLREVEPHALARLASLTNLKEFYIDTGYAATDPTISYLPTGLLGRLTSLYVNGDDTVAGPPQHRLFQCIGEHAHSLTELSVGRAEVTEADIDAIVKLTQLKSLSLYNVDDEIELGAVYKLSTLSHLEWLDFNSSDDPNFSPEPGTIASFARLQREFEDDEGKFKPGGREAW